VITRSTPGEGPGARPEEGTGACPEYAPGRAAKGGPPAADAARRQHGGISPRQVAPCPAAQQSAARPGRSPAAAGVTRRPGGPHTGDDVAAHAGEVRVNVGGEPDRDDFGLPPVDIEIPDDARELDRDVQAYRRELRALRRQMRIGRLHAPLTRDGLVLPLLAGCLAMVLISGVLLTVFTAGRAAARACRQVAAQVTHASIRPVPTAARAPRRAAQREGNHCRPARGAEFPEPLGARPGACGLPVQRRAAPAQASRRLPPASACTWSASTETCRRSARLAARAGQPRGRGR
jgi:hypothetical protein